MDPCPDKSSVFRFHCKGIEKRHPWSKVSAAPRRGSGNAGDAGSYSR